MEGVKIWEEQIIIPTYEIGEADKNPIFLDKRVYQGSTGKIYPYPTVETISDVKIEKAYKAVYLENEYIRVMILPELGGRIQRAYDKTNDYDFVYYNHVIKPALVGLTGPWISGGIEFNWPQHHRPTTYQPVDYQVVEHEDGSKSVLVNDVDQMYGTKGIAGFTLYPGKSYIEIRGQLYNPTPQPQTFLWWANPAVPVNDDTQSIFPPDVRAVMDHGKRDVSRFPIATGVYYKHDYSEGVDISRYKNIPVPTSYMAEKSKYDFVGGYDHKLRAGILHVADHHISPGKKQWTWGCGDFGKAWDRNLTDEDGPYIELMTGVYTDNQPDFTWLKPFEEKTFKQYFMPYKAVGAVKNATIHGAVNMEKGEAGIYICAYATERYENAVIEVTYDGTSIFKEQMTLSPVDIYETTIKFEAADETKLKITVSAAGQTLVSYQPEKPEEEQIPEPAKAAGLPEEMESNEELYLTGLHIEQYRHATYLPDPYYLEGLRRDSGDMRINNAYGALLMRRGLFTEAETCFRKAVERATWKNPNPYNSEPYYNLGLCLWYQERLEEAYDAFFKATWSNEQQEMSFYYLAAIDARLGNYDRALEMVGKSLVKNSHHIKARGLKAYLLRKIGRNQAALAWIGENLLVDPFDYLSMFEKSFSDQENQNKIRVEMNGLMRDFGENYLRTARDYAEFGAYDAAAAILSECTQDKPMLFYYRAYYLGRQGKEPGAMLERAEQACPDYCFPNKAEDITVLQNAITKNPGGAKAHYYLGCLYYDKQQFQTATKLWEKSAALDDTFPTVFRNLALSYYNKMDRKQEAREKMERAFALNPSDARIFLELDQLYKKLEMSAEERLANYNAHPDTFGKRDDAVIEYITLHNQLGRYEEAYQLTMARKFHPWEGGEGKITTQYTVALVELAKVAKAQSDYAKAEQYLLQALVYPENLGEGKLEGTKDNHIYYNLGCVKEAMGDAKEAERYFEQASVGSDEPAGMMYYNDQPADMILYQGMAKQKLHKDEEATARFNRLIDYGQQHRSDQMKIEYFAVSLPDFLIFEDDLNVRNKAHCAYLIGLGNLGLGHKEEAVKYFEQTLEYDKTHLNAIRYKR